MTNKMIVFEDYRKEVTIIGFSNKRFKKHNKATDGKPVE